MGCGNKHRFTNAIRYLLENISSSVAKMQTCTRPGGPIMENEEIRKFIARLKERGELEIDGNYPREEINPNRIQPFKPFKEWERHNDIIKAIANCSLRFFTAEFIKMMIDVNEAKHEQVMMNRWKEICDAAMKGETKWTKKRKFNF